MPPRRMLRRRGTLCVCQRNVDGVSLVTRLRHSGPWCVGTSRAVLTDANLSDGDEGRIEGGQMDTRKRRQVTREGRDRNKTHKAHVW